MKITGNNFAHPLKLNYLQAAKVNVTRNKIYQQLKSNPLFSDTPDEVLEVLSGKVRCLDVGACEGIVRKNEVGDCMYIIVRGRVKAHDKGIQVAQLGQGEFFGELALLKDNHRSLSVTALDKTQLLEISRDAIMRVMRKSPVILMRILGEIILRLRSQNEVIILQMKSREKELHEQVAERTADLEQKNIELSQTLSKLKETQHKLIKKEKLATIGQIATKIAHEVQNPLNFVNNFSEINLDLMDELVELLSKSGIDEESGEALQQLVENTKIIHQHGKRVASIANELLQKTWKQQG